MANHSHQTARVPHLRELAALWRQEAERSDTDRGFCLRMAKAQDEATDAILVGPEAHEALYQQHWGELQQSEDDCPLCGVRPGAAHRMRSCARVAAHAPKGRGGE
jgi:hypothetical protein